MSVLIVGPKVVSSTRCKLLCGTAAAVSGASIAALVLSPDPSWGSAVAMVDPDAKLLALCDRLHAIDQQAHELDSREDKAAEAEREAFSGDCVVDKHGR